MAHVSIAAQELVISVQGLDKLWSLKSELRLPLAHVASAALANDEARSWFHGLRVAGTNIPGVITAGTFHPHEGWVFWDVHDPAKAIAITLHDDRYAKIVIEVADPGATIAAINAARG